MGEVKDFITDLYRGILGREPDVAGLNYYEQCITTGDMRRDELIAAFIRSSEFRGRQAGEDTPVTNEPLGPHGCLISEAMDVFRNWPLYSGPPRLGFVTNFLGCVTDVSFVNGLSRLSGIIEGYPLLGNFHGDTLEWLGTLRAVLDARDSFSMLELGAGWGPWCSIGYRAAKMRGIDAVRVVAVEGDAGHVSYIQKSFAANEVPQDCSRIVAGVVGTKDGMAYFPKVKDPSRAYGGAAAYDKSQERGPFADFLASQEALLESVDTVACYGLETLLRDFLFVDLVHCDIQGEEENLFKSSIELFSAKVRRCVIGTHSFAIDRALINLLPLHGWVLENADVCVMHQRDNSAWTERDGTQVWRNRQLVPN